MGYPERYLKASRRILLWRKSMCKRRVYMSLRQLRKLLSYGKYDEFHRNVGGNLLRSFWVSWWRLSDAQMWTSLLDRARADSGSKNHHACWDHKQPHVTQRCSTAHGWMNGTRLSGLSLCAHFDPHSSSTEFCSIPAPKTEPMIKFKATQTRTYDVEGFKRRAACLCFKNEKEDEVRFDCLQGRGQSWTCSIFDPVPCKLYQQDPVCANMFFSCLSELHIALEVSLQVPEMHKRTMISSY